jgi:hypothetical protein
METGQPISPPLNTAADKPYRKLLLPNKITLAVIRTLALICLWGAIADYTVGLWTTGMITLAVSILLIGIGGLFCVQKKWVYYTILPLVSLAISA